MEMSRANAVFVVLGTILVAIALRYALPCRTIDHCSYSQLNDADRQW